MLLQAPQSFFPAYVTGVLLCFCYGGICSMPSVWNKLFPKLPDGSLSTGSYLKAGEYGETELNTSWSVFKEPLNAWTSLTYSLFGIVIVYVGISDMFFATGIAPNRISFDPSFSVLFGFFCIYLGMASFLFHASHSEVWRKADAGMTSGTVLPLVVFAVWDRLRPPAVTSFVMVALSVLLLISLTHGYLPYGSSDVLLPSLVAFMWIVELFPRYGGVVDTAQYMLWLQCFFAVAGGALLRAIDIKRHAPTAMRNLLGAYLTVLGVFAVALGPLDGVVICGAVFGGVVVKWPEKGHIFWHFGSAFALYIWWYMLRVRPGDPATATNSDSHLVSILFFAAIKNAVRRIFMNVPTSIFPSTLHRDRTKNLLEHLLFAAWGGWVLFLEAVPQTVKTTAASSSSSSWLYNAQQCWESGGLSAATGLGPDSLFHLFYLARVGAHVEEVIFALVARQQAASALREAHLPSASSSAAVVNNKLELEMGVQSPAVDSTVSTSSTSRETDGLLSSSITDASHGGGSSASSSRSRDHEDPLLLAHHLLAALLCLSSYFTGYLRIGLIVMFLHDLSDVPLDVLQLLDLRAWKKAQVVALGLTVLSWMYWRVYIFCAVVLRAVVVDSKSMLNQSPCRIGSCSWSETPERAPYVICLLVLLGFNAVWLRRLSKRFYKEMSAGAPKTNI